MNTQGQPAQVDSPWIERNISLILKRLSDISVDNRPPRQINELLHMRPARLIIAGHYTLAILHRLLDIAQVAELADAPA